MRAEIAVLAALVAAGCVTPNANECSTGKVWTGGNEESPLMHPGMDCIACHEESGEGPLYSVAGTVMGAVDDPDDCYGVQGAVVTLTDADGVDHQLVTNEAGNFFTNEAVPTPYTVTVEYNGASSVMVSAQADGACITCHTQDGANLAPGRIVAP